VFYDQIDGVAMGSPLGPLFANVFMANFEKNHMHKLRELGVIKWYRYVDDVFATLKEKSQADSILKYMNEQHPNIKFTIEHEENNTLPFLDTCVLRGVIKYKTTVYRKKTFTGVYLNWTSLTSRKYKIGVINCLAERAWRICTEREDKMCELNKLRAILARNDYPTEVVNQTINKFLERKNREEVQPPKEKKEHKRFLKLPFVHRKCDEYGRRLKQIVTNSYPQVDFNVAFQTPMNVGKLFPFKDNIKNVEDRSLVVYNIKCATCGVEYIGKTERILAHRISEHKKNDSSACKQHTKSFPTHQMDYDNVRVLDSADDNRKLCIKELLHILTRKPELNKQLGSQSNFEIKTLIIKAYPQFRK